MTYNSKLVFTVRVPEPGTRAAAPARTLVELKPLRGWRLGRAASGRMASRLAVRAVRATDRHLGGTVRGSRYNSWWLQLAAALLTLLVGLEVIAVGLCLLGVAFE